MTDLTTGTKMKTIIINIFGAPGSGKSTLAADLYTQMKQEGKSVELVRECVKKWAYNGHKPSFFEQVYITTEQMLEESALYGKVQYLITDSPVDLGNFYCNYYFQSDALAQLDNRTKLEGKITRLIDKSINIYLPIDETIYKNEGRYSSLEESKKIEIMMNKFVTEKYNMVKVLDCPVNERKAVSLEYVAYRELM